MSTAGPDATTPTPAPASSDDGHLHRGLSNRHIQLIAIGGAIGTGLFMGSGRAISLAGPGLLLVYLIIGIVLFGVMRAMGELLLHNLEYKSFQDFAGDLIGPWASFVIGWTYWLCWIVTGMADVIAFAGYMQWFWPQLQLWIPPILLLAALMALNLLTVKLFGELEFWFALIKVIAIIALILVGVVLIVIGFQHGGTTASLTHLWTHGGFFPTGWGGFFAGFQIALFAFVGIELVGTTAAETKDPTVTLPRAINSIPVRIVLFYIGSLTIIMSVTPWDEVDPELSPFVNMFSLIGIGAAAAIVNFVVATSAASAANSGMFSTSRMIYGLASSGQAPRSLARLNARKVPARALMMSVICFLPVIILLVAGESVMAVFTVVTTISSVLFVVVWSMILISYISYRRRFPDAHAASAYKMHGGAAAAGVILAFFVFFLVLLLWFPDTRQALLLTPIWFVLLAVAWFAIRGRRARHTVEP